MRTSVDALVEEALNSCKPEDVGMVLVHKGVVRGVSRDGRPVKGLQVEVDEEKIKRIEDKYRGYKGIGYVKIVARGGFLRVGEEIMTVVVAGKFRGDVIPVLSSIVDEVKAVSRKKEVLECL